MDSLRQFCFRLAGLFRRRSVEAEMAEEMRQHLERRTREKIADGMTPDEARYAAQRKFGGVTQVQEQCRDERVHGLVCMEQLKERCRDQTTFMWLEQLRQDLRNAARQLARSPGFAAVAELYARNRDRR